MPDSENPDLTRLTVDLLSAYLSNNSVPSNELPDLIEQTRTALAAQPKSTAESEPVYKPAVSVEDSTASREHILSLIDGKPYKSLKRHLSNNGLTPAEYRSRYGLAVDYPMVAPAYSEHRRAVAQRMGLGGRPGAVKRDTAPTAPKTEAPAPAAKAPAAKAASAKPATAGSGEFKAAPAKPAKAPRAAKKRFAREPQATTPKADTALATTKPAPKQEVSKPAATKAATAKPKTGKPKTGQAKSAKPADTATKPETAAAPVEAKPAAPAKPKRSRPAAAKTAAKTTPAKAAASSRKARPKAEAAKPTNQPE